MLKTASSVTNALGALNYKGTWDANANNPNLVTATPLKGDYYVVSVAGTTTLSGISLWSVGDWAVYNGSAWQKVDGGTSEAYVNLTVSGTANIATANVANFVSANVQITGGTFSGTNVTATNGVWSINQFNGAYTDGIVADYVTGNGRISVGINDVLTFYVGGPGNVATGNVTATGTWNQPNVVVSGTANVATGNLTNLISGNVTLTGGNVSVNLSGSTNLNVANAVSTLSTTHGGTGLTSFTSGGVVYATSTSALSTAANFLLTSAGSNPSAGLNVTPSAWLQGGTRASFEFGSPGNAIWGYAGEMRMMQNAYYSNSLSNFAYGSTSVASALYEQGAGNHIWYVAPAGTADAAITFTSAMKLFNSGGFSLGDTTDPGAGNLRLGTGNLVIGTSGKGIDFSAVVHSGSTSKLLADYEIGTWTPTVTAGTGTITTVGTVSGSYTKVGRLVVLGYSIVITNNGTGASNIQVSNLPFAAGTINNGSGQNTSTGTIDSIYISPSFNSGGTFIVTKYDGAYPVASGQTLIGTIAYTV